MFKKMIFSLGVISILASFSLLTYSFNNDPRYDPSTPSTGEFMAVITRPQGVSETTFRNMFLLCGVNYDRKLRFEALVFNPNSGLYEPASMLKGVHTWEMSQPGVFAEQMYLEKSGVNNIRIAAYDLEGTDFIPGKNLQISNYAITLMGRNEEGHLGTGFGRISRMLSQIFGS
jgi:hypothetical protein